MAARAGRRLQMITSQLQTRRRTAPQPVQSSTTGFTKRPVKVVVTGAAGNIGYAIIFMIGQGRLLGPDQPIELRLLDIPPMAGKVKGVQMEIQDCSFPIFTSVVATSDYKEAFQDVEVALLIGARPRGPGMERKDLLKANAAIFQGQGKALDKYANRNVKVLVVGNPANTNALIAATNAPNLPAENFTAMTRLDQSRAIGQISERLSVPVSSVKNLIIWGNHSSTQFPDVSQGYITDFPQSGAVTPIRAAVQDDAYLDGPFITTVQKRGAAVIAARKLSSAASAANAALDHMRSWLMGTPQGEYVSMGVPSDGSYGVPRGIVFSFPCTCSGGTYRIVQGLQLSPFAREKIRATADELLQERAAALGQ